MAIIFTRGSSQEPNAVGQKIGQIGEARTLGYAAAGGAMMSTGTGGKIMAMWMPIIVFFYLGFEHSIVNMFLFPPGTMLGGEFTWLDYFAYNEMPVVLGNLVGGLTFVGCMIYMTHFRESPKRNSAVAVNNDAAGVTAA